MAKSFSKRKAKEISHDKRDSPSHDAYVLGLTAGEQLTRTLSQAHLSEAPGAQEAEALYAAPRWHYTWVGSSPSRIQRS